MQLEQLASLLVVGALLAGVGRGVTGMVFPEGTGTEVRGKWTPAQRAFFFTMWAHPIVVGALLGIPDWLPAPAFMGVGDKVLVGRVVWYAVAGVFSSAAFYRLERHIKDQPAGGR